MVYRPTAREIRVKEYGKCIDKYMNVNRSLKTGVAGVLIVNGVLLTVFQTTFSKELEQITKYMTPDHPGFVIIQLVPTIGILFSVLLVAILFDWVVRRNSVLSFGFWLENNLKISINKHGHGFFTNVLKNRAPFIGRILFTLCIAFYSFSGWHSVKESVDNIVTQIIRTQKVGTKGFKGKRIPMPQFEKKGE